MSDKPITIARMKPGDVFLGHSVNPVNGEVIVTIRRADGTITEEAARMGGDGPIDPADAQFAINFPIYGGIRA